MLLCIDIAPNPAKARELMRDVFSRSQMAEMMISGPSTMMAMMGLAPVQFGEQIKTGSKAVMAAFEGVSL